jgi:hypothetical protein
VAKWSQGPYLSGNETTRWIKVKNPSYSQAQGRREMFEAFRDGRRGMRPGTHETASVKLPASNDFTETLRSSYARWH